MWIIFIVGLICVAWIWFFNYLSNVETEFAEELSLISETLNDEVLKKYIESNLKWYVRKAEFYKWIYRGFSIAHLLIIAFTPVIALTTDSNPLKIAVAAAISGSIFGILSLLDPRKKWKRYRVTAEILKNKLMHFYKELLITGNDQEKKSKLIESLCETILEENNVWKKEDSFKLENNNISK